jgi:hypothetical protein
MTSTVASSVAPSTRLFLSMRQSERLAAAMSAVLDAFLMVSTLENTIPAQLITKRVTLPVTLLAPPLLHCREHNLTNLARAIISIFTEGRMVKDAGNDAGQSSIDIGILIIPALHQLGN